ncbi:GNAT family N-acetyltransferase [Streptomyces sp. NPDC049906]|uniref:GNAT family N-acetyltransferase n=1 Tax=Streptomyces sp. NPDC049906 TaxID=3155656 RepID=UPI003439D88D
MPTVSPRSAAADRNLPAVRLRVPTHEDAHSWYRVFDDPEVMAFLGGSSAERSAYEELTARQRRHHAELGFCLWTVTAFPREGGTADTAGETVLGFAGAQPWPHSWGPVGEIEIGWRLGRAHWGRGYATAAMLAGLDAVRAAGVGRVAAVVDPRNTRSVAIAERLGMARGEEYEAPGGRWVRVFRLEC